MVSLMDLRGLQRQIVEVGRLSRGNGWEKRDIICQVAEERIDVGCNSQNGRHPDQKGHSGASRGQGKDIIGAGSGNQEVAEQPE